jgi:pyruvate,water dikinase
MKLIAALDEISAADRARVGGKAVALAALFRAEMTVPQTFCLTTEAYELFVDRASLRAVIHQELSRKDFADMRWEEVWDLALRIRNRFLRAPVPEEIVTALRAFLPKEFLQRPVAVRSSAPGEDSAGTSFAGLHDSVVGVEGLPATIEAIRTVWASLWTDRALLYRRELAIDVNASAMAVLIQELVEGSRSGIAFGIQPTDPELVAIEAVYGLNQGLVDGTIEPDRWSLERDTARTVEHIAPTERRRLVVRGSRTTVESVPPKQAASPPLNGKELAEIFAAVRDAGQLFGLPQDVEWTLADGLLVLLQSRPVTAAPDGEGDKRGWYLSLTRSLHSLVGLRERVENELLPAMDREAAALARQDLAALGSVELAEAIQVRHEAHDRWVDVYSREFIPLAHGVRLFGQFHNQVLHPEDPYEFMGLLVATPMLSVRRNRALASLAAKIRSSPELRTRLEAGEKGDSQFEQALADFEGEFGEASFASRRCFGDRLRLIRFLLSLADAPAVAEPRDEAGIDRLTETFLAAVDDEKRPLARELLDLGRASHRLRDDDNIHLSRLEALVLSAVEEGRRRLRDASDGEQPSLNLEEMVRTLRHPNLVSEPRPADEPPEVEEGFRAKPRQLVGQPAGPGVATGAARIVENADDLFQFQTGEVLVCDAIDPNMTFIVPMASAVVERRGGMLIHGAIIAREYGLPCVTGVPKATNLIVTGDRLTVDGYLGLVTVSRD